MSSHGRDGGGSERCVLIRYGEIGLKGKNRPEFESLLRRRLKGAMRGLPSRVEREAGRLFLRSPAPFEEIEARLRRVFGIVSFSPVEVAPLDLEAILSAAAQVFERAREAEPGARSFKVAARRANKRFPLDSLELNRRLGAHLHALHPDLRVDVHRPDLVLSLEVRDEAYLYARVVPGPGGLPVGMSGTAHLLLSGGIDSPVAGYLGMKRGLRIEGVHFHSYPFTSERAKQKAIDLARILSPYNGGGFTLHVVPFTAVLTAIHESCDPGIAVTLMRRMMLRIAEAIARRRGGGALLTGESLGQVASQTLESMQVIGEVAGLPLLRPLVAADKSEIIDLARRIGTFEVSIRPYEDCCTVFLPPNPRTRPRLEEVRRAESRLEVGALCEEAVAGTETLSLHAGEPARDPGEAVREAGEAARDA